ncbi:MAG: arsenite methyltransferase [Spirochaetota bacterium]|nr:arsenite methyltransferase [Spirochaetota bacterium]
MSNNDEKIKEKVKKAYSSAINKKKTSCCSPTENTYVNSIGYNDDEIKKLPSESVENSFGCGNPLAFALLNEGDTVLDIGSGLGIDVFIASKRVGESGRVYGLDMTPQMIERAKENANKSGYNNVEFILGDADNIPLDDGTVDLVISNCVINLTPNKEKVFKEIYRVLKPGGTIMISDILSESLPKEVLEIDFLYTSCIAGAISEKDYINAISKAGFKDIKVVSKEVYDESAISSFSKCCSDESDKLKFIDIVIDKVSGKISSAKIQASKPAN